MRLAGVGRDGPADTILGYAESCHEVRVWAEVRYANVWGALPFILLGTFALLHGRAFPATATLGVGPRFFPSIMASSMLLLAFILVLLSLTGRETLRLPPVPREALTGWVAAAVAVVVALAAWRSTGYLAAVFVLTAGLTQYFERDVRWWRVLLFAGGLTATMWGIFTLLLDVPVRLVG